MKKIFILMIASAALVNVACKKERTCACKVTSTTKRTVTPRSAGSSTVTELVNTDDISNTYSEVKKSELKRVYNCNSYVQTSTNTGTTVILVPAITGSGSFTFAITKSETADQVLEYKSDYACEIK